MAVYTIVWNARFGRSILQFIKRRASATSSHNAPTDKWASVIDLCPFRTYLCGTLVNVCVTFTCLEDSRAFGHTKFVMECKEYVQKCMMRRLNMSGAAGSVHDEE